MNHKLDPKLHVGQLIVVEKNVYGINKKEFINKKFVDNIIMSRNKMIPKYTMGVVVGFVNENDITMAIVSLNNDSHDTVMLDTKKLTELKQFIERIDNE